MSGYEIQGPDGATVYEGDTFMDCVTVARTKKLSDDHRIVAVLINVGELHEDS